MSAMPICATFSTSLRPPRHFAAVVMERPKIFMAGFMLSAMPTKAAAVGIRPDLAAYFKS